MPRGLRAQFCIPPDNQYLIAEIYVGGEHFGEFNTEGGQLQLIIFPRCDGEAWQLQADDIQALEAAKREFISRSVFFTNVS